MPRNVEIKARVADPQALAARAAQVADSGPEVLRQDDTFFHAPDGRLKLRAFPDGRGELIAYRRPDAATARLSTYRITPVADAAELRALLAGCLGVRGRVRKERQLYLAGATRIHLDRVEGLGAFVELEVVLGEDQAAAAGEATARELMQRLGIAGDDLVAGAYLDLMEPAP